MSKIALFVVALSFACGLAHKQPKPDSGSIYFTGDCYLINDAVSTTYSEVTLTLVGCGDAPYDVFVYDDGLHAEKRGKDSQPDKYCWRGNKKD